ncbi:MAG: hypothetical protein QOH56_4388 [Pseudonocardiales bacterium]|nr:hypothetical protein [Pseudonocardiales bacterium]
MPAKTRSWDRSGRLAVIDRWDGELFRRVANHRSPALDAVLPRLTAAADHSLLWLAASALARASGNKTATRAAGRGLLSIAVASALANQVAKRVLPRRRPDVALIPVNRVARRMPVSASFPSGHSASAAAFAFGAGLESRRLGAAIGVVAAGVCLSRVYTGAHYPSDVVAGAALGFGCAALVAKVVPVVGPEAQRHEQRGVRNQPPRPTGRGVVAVINPASGSGAGALLIELVRSRLPAAEVVELAPGDDLLEQLREASARAEVLAVGGGDGSMNAGAQVALDTGLPLLALTGGTFNHFTTDVGLADAEHAITCLQAGTTIDIEVASANDQIFLNTSSIGSYPAFVARREALERRIGKPLAAAYAAVATMRHEVPMSITVDGRDHTTALLFVGNGRYLPRGFVPGWRPRLDDGLLDVRLLDVGARGATVRIAFALLTGRLARSPLYVEAAVPKTTITIRDGATKLALDGELFDGAERIDYRIHPASLTVFGPADPA